MNSLVSSNAFSSFFVKSGKKKRRIVSSLSDEWERNQVTEDLERKRNPVSLISGEDVSENWRSPLATNTLSSMGPGGFLRNFSGF